MQERCAEGVHKVADMAVCFELVATYIELRVFGICFCSFDGGDAFLLEDVGAENDERFIGVEVLHESQGTAIFTPAFGILGLYKNVSKLVVAVRRVLGCMCGTDECLEDFFHFVFVTFFEVMLQDSVVILGECGECVGCEFNCIVETSLDFIQIIWVGLFVWEINASLRFSPLGKSVSSNDRCIE